MMILAFYYLFVFFTIHMSMISSHLEFVSIYYYEITDIIIKKTRDVDGKEGEGERQIKRKVHQEEHRQISGHATISVRIVRVCAR